MILLSELLSLLTSLVALIDRVYIYVISAFWSLSVKYGLNPGYAFAQNEFTNTRFSSLLDSFTGFYPQLIAIAFTISSLIYLFENSFIVAQEWEHYLIRAFLVFSVIIFSFDIIRGILYLENSLYSTIWSNSGIAWNSLISLIGNHLNIGFSLNLSQNENNVVEFFLLTALFASVGTLFGVLMLRVAIILILVVVLPFLSTLLFIRRFDSFTLRFWSLFLQLSIIPFLTLIPLYIAAITVDDFPLQLALIVSAALLPVLFVTSSRVFSVGSFLSMLDAFNFQRVLSDNPFPRINSVIGNLQYNNSSVGSNNQPISSSGIIDWTKLYARDLEYRRFG